MALSVLAALYHRDLTGEGQWIDASQTEAGIMLTQVPVLDWGANGRSWERNGNRSPYQEIAPQGIYQCAGDDRWIAITCASQGQWRALAHLAGHDDWAADPRFASAAGRIAHYDELDDGITAWTRSFEPYGLMARLQAAGVPAGVCQTAADRCDNDPQLRHLGWLTELTGTRIGRWPLAEIPVRMSRTPPYLGGRPDRAAPLYGEDNVATHRPTRDVRGRGGGPHGAGSPIEILYDSIVTSISDELCGRWMPRWNLREPPDHRLVRWRRKARREPGRLTFIQGRLAQPGRAPP